MGDVIKLGSVEALMKSAYTFVFYALLLINSGSCRLVKINFAILKDTAFILSKSCFDQCRYYWIMSVLKSTDRQTDERKDR